MLHIYNLFVRNVPAEVKEALCLFYADDLTLMMKIQKGEEGEAAQKLDEYLERLHSWGDQWLLEFEATKSQSLLVSNKRKDSRAQHRPLSMDGFTVEEKEQLKALGQPQGQLVTSRPTNSSRCEEEAWGYQKGSPLAGQPVHHDGLQSLCEI